jgi:hypothetical protein
MRHLQSESKKKLSLSQGLRILSLLKTILIRLICLALAFSFSGSLYAGSCTTNSNCTSDPDGPTCIGGVCDSCCNAIIESPPLDCETLGPGTGTCVWNDDYSSCQDNQFTLCPTEQIPEAPFSFGARWLWLLLAGFVAVITTNQKVRLYFWGLIKRRRN